MASKFAKLKVDVLLGEEFNDYIEKILFDYLKISQEKWGFSLTEEQVDSVVMNSYAQLRRKVEEVYKTELGSLPLEDDFTGNEEGAEEQQSASHNDVKDLDDSYDREEEVLEVDIPDFSRVVVEVKSELHTPGSEVIIVLKDGRSLTSGEAGGDLLLLRTSSGYVVADEISDSTVWLSEFDKEMKHLITKWMDTAVFYSVASFM